jgi:hypothetical protein
MSTIYKVLGQGNPAANTATTIYTVPSSNSAVISSMAICNQGSGNALVNINVCVANANIAANNKILNNVNLVTNDTVFLTLGVTMAATDTLRANISTANVSISVFGSEIS